MKFCKIISLLAALVLLSACSFPTGDDLLAAPQPGQSYQSLQTQLESILAGGETYAVPAGGENRSTVQLIDLDNDGVEESVSFFRGSSTASSNSFSVYVHRKEGTDYVLAGAVRGSGLQIQEVDYPMLDTSGRRGIVIAWKLAGDTGGLTVCDLTEELAPRVLLETEYLAYELADLTDSGTQDLLTIAQDAGGRRAAHLYTYTDGELRQTGNAAVSSDAVSVVQMKTGNVAEMQPAVFAEQRIESGIGLLTDIFVWQDGMLQNLALDGEDAITRGTYRPLSVYATDVNTDGVTELPRAVLMAGYADAAAPDALYMLDWYRYSAHAAPEWVTTTYQNVSEDWMVLLDPDWHDSITAQKTQENGISIVEFSLLGGGETLPLFRIYSVSSTMYNYYSGRSDLIPLGTANNLTFYGKIADGAAGIVSEEDLQTRFSRVAKDWAG